MTAPDIHRGVLDNLLDGVLVVGRGGRIETLNPAAGRMLGIEPDDAAGSTFAELFVARDGFDEFTQTIFDAMLEEDGPERRVVGVAGDGEPRSLSVATSYLRGADGTGGLSVIAVFSDITELRELRETELRLAKAAEEQHDKLQGAYREIEGRNAALAAALRKVRLAQGLGLVLVIGMFAGIGALTWQPDLAPVKDLFGGRGVAAAPAAGDGEAALRTLVASPQPISSSIVLKGRLAPSREAEVKSPVEGIVRAVHFRQGQAVARGDVLVELDLARLERQYRSQRFKVLQAEERFETLKNWERSVEMTKARRAFTKARLSMASARSRMNRATLLSEKGLIAATELEEAERQHQNQLLDFEAAREQFEAAKAKGGKDAAAQARLALENERAVAAELEEKLARGQVVAPFDGVVLPRAKGEKKPVEGAAVQSNDTLLRIGDFSRIAVNARADEIDVVKMRAGQKAAVIGNAFPGLVLRGDLAHVSAQADSGSGGKPRFRISILLEPLSKADQARVRIGMSAKLRVVTYSNPKALLVPLDAVSRRGGKHRLRVLNPKTGEPELREVRIGPTTMRDVEIASGLKPGERVVLPGG